MEEGVPPFRARLAERLRVSAPAVTELTQKLAREGLIRAGRTLEFTRTGREAALAAVRRHRLLERLLTDLLGIPWYAAHEEAARLEHHVSPTLEERLAKTLGDPASCPHGNPIPAPGEAPRTDPLLSLDQATPGRYRVVRFVERLELEAESMKTLDSWGIRPGSLLLLLGQEPDGSRVAAAGSARTIPHGWAFCIRVEKAGDPDGRGPRLPIGTNRRRSRRRAGT